MTATESLTPSASGTGRASVHMNGEVRTGDGGTLLAPADGEDDVRVREEIHKIQEEGIDERHPDIDGGWAWVICFASFFANFLLDGVLFAFGVIILELLDYFEDSKSKTALVGSVLLGFSIAMGPVVSLLLEFFSCRQVMILGSLISSVGFVLSVFAPNIETLIFTYGALGGSGFGLSFVTAILVVGLHFNEKRALATGIAMSGSGVGTFAISYLTERLLEWYGWRGTVLIIAGLVLNCCVCGALMRPLVKRPTKVPSCCSSSQKVSFCHRKFSSSLNDDLEQCSLQEEEWKSPPVEKPFLKSIDTLVLAEKKTRLFHSNEHMIPSVDLSRRQYKSDLHLHNFQSLTPALDANTRVIKQALGQPIRRKDIFYSGSLYNLPEYKKDPNMRSFLKSMTSLHRSEYGYTSRADFSVTVEETHEKLTFIAAHKELLCDKLFLMLLFVMTAWTGHASILTYVPDLAVSRGVSSTQAALLVSAVGCTNTIGRLFAGWLTNRPEVDSVVVYTCAILLAGVVSAIFPLCNSFPVFIVCCCIFGLCMASCVSLRTVVLADVLGVSKLTKAFGIVAFLQGVAFTVGPPISGALYDWTQSFLPPFLLAGSMYLVSGITCAVVRPAQKYFTRTSCLPDCSDNDTEASRDFTLKK
ncbi:monocarboxylate transporter 12-like [Liolophura sinensis]|uniref:monocarboxylate transporter 12-like n=1 Tax=Liolophura sinensis TaxID=3198878 RepID=UPI003158C539